MIASPPNTTGVTWAKAVNQHLAAQGATGRVVGVACDAPKVHLSLRLIHCLAEARDPRGRPGSRDICMEVWLTSGIELVGSRQVRLSSCARLRPRPGVA